MNRQVFSIGIFLAIQFKTNALLQLKGKQKTCDRKVARAETPLLAQGSALAKLTIINDQRQIIQKNLQTLF